MPLDVHIGLLVDTDCVFKVIFWNKSLQDESGNVRDLQLCSIFCFIFQWGFLQESSATSGH